MLISGIFGLVTFAQFLLYDIERTGYASLVLLIIFLSSIQLIFLGIMGEYIGKIHIETKKRPLYFAEVIDKQNEDK